MRTVDRVFDQIVRNQTRRKRVVQIAGIGAMAAIAVGTVHYATVRPGDTLSSLAAKACGNAHDWTGIYQQNLLTIGHNPNLIFPGQHLAFKCDAAVISTALAASHNSSANPPLQQHSGSRAMAQAPATTYHGSGSMQACIIARESGGNSQVVNASGHYGLYQFSYSTWVGSGGSSSDFGHASVSEQNQVFANAVAARGYSDWTPYDGC